MTNNYDPNQKRGGPANAGNWTKYENSDPEAVMGETTPAVEPTAAEPEFDWRDAIPVTPVTPVTLPETQRRLRGHKFFPSEMKKWPAIYANDSAALADVPFVAHYFVGGADWYISEVDQNTGEAFGYADLGLGSGEYGYISLTELEGLVVRPSGFPQAVERDLSFKSGTKASEVIDKYKPARVG